MLMHSAPGYSRPKPPTPGLRSGIRGGKRRGTREEDGRTRASGWWEKGGVGVAVARDDVRWRDDRACQSRKYCIYNPKLWGTNNLIVSRKRRRCKHGISEITA
ncbi:hypothetical protein FOMPIDRAFT_1017693 [Fomitopsis schrenkii]|uniref:Uncharacterized protein n=1 Tax=Fomitopsis schrenkii TaxID=2126942 RepID=S8DZP5_FOMSC|nr:hypothetical protein FOMPIDRAFT_1017693 [Fomitopsis schrenkii]